MTPEVKSIKICHIVEVGQHARASEKMESIRFRRLGTAAFMSEKSPQNHDWFCRLLFLKSPEVPNRANIPRNLWILNLRSAACVPNYRETVDSIFRKQGRYAQPDLLSCPGQMTPEVKWPMQIAPIKPAAVPMFPPHTSPLPTALMRNEA